MTSGITNAIGRSSRLKSAWTSALVLTAMARGGSAQPPATDPDLNNDGIVNILDVSLASSCYGQSPPLRPEVQITDPLDGSIVSASPLAVSGTVDVDNVDVDVDVNGVPAQTTGQDFTAQSVPLQEGLNTLTATARTAPHPCVVADVDADGDVDLDDVDFVSASFGQSGFPVGEPDPGVRVATSSVQVTLEPTQPELKVGVIAGEVYDDTTGLPLEGAAIRLVSLEGEPPAGVNEAESDARGRFRLVSPPGRARLHVTKEGFTSAERGVDVVEGRRTDPRDARLTPLESAPEILSSVLGGEVTGASGRVRLDVPPGALADDAALNLTWIGAQGLAGDLPPGWSPVAAFEISPTGLAFGFEAQASLSVPGGLPEEATLPVARWDSNRGVWIALGEASLSQDGRSLQLAVAASGHYAVLLGDAPPNGPPPPTVGEALTGLASPALPDSATAEIRPSPRILLASPDARSDVTVLASSSTQAHSGSRLVLEREESFDFVDGTHLYLEPFDQEHVLFAFPSGSDPSNLVSEFTVGPSRTVEPRELELGIIELAVRIPSEPGAPRGTVVGPAGGAAETPTGERVVVPPGATTEPLPVRFEPLAPEAFPAAAPAGLSLEAAARFDLHGGSLNGPARFSLPASGAVSPDSTLLVVQIVELAGASHLALVALAEHSGDRFETVTDPRADGSVLLPGPRGGGRFAFLSSSTALGLVTGTVTGENGLPIAGALVVIDTLGVVALSDAEGRYVLAAPPGTLQVTAIDPVSGDEVTVTASLDSADDVVAVDPQTETTAPFVTSISPASGATDVDLAAAVRVTFSESIDPASVDGSTLLVADGAAPIGGSLSLQPGNTSLSFRPSSLLASQATYQVTVAASARDLSGNAMGAPFVSSFTTVDLTPPPRPEAGNLTATIPDESGTSTVAGTQGTAEPGTAVVVRNVTTGELTTVTAEADGSFSAVVDASPAAELELVLRDAAGNETVVELGPFENPDGSVVVGAEGGRVEGPGGVFVDIPQGALPPGTVVKVDPLVETELPLPAPADFPFSGGVRLDLGGAVPSEPLDIGVPAPLDASASDQVVVARAIHPPTGTAWTVADRAHLEDGRYVTASPPFVGVVAEGDYAFLRSGHGCVSYVTVQLQLRQDLILLLTGMPFVFFDVSSATLPAVCDSELDIEVRDPDTDALLRKITRRAPAERDAISSVPDVLTDDSEPPTITHTNALSGQLIREVEIRFSEPMNADSVRQGLTVLDAEGFSVPGEVLMEDGNRLARFRPTSPFQLADRHTVVLLGAKDLAGNFLESTEISFTPLSIGEPISELGERPEFAALLDKCNATGSCRKSTRDSIVIGTTLFLANGLGSADEQYRDPSSPQRLLAVDVSDPRAPGLVGSHPTATNPLALGAVEGASLDLPDGTRFEGDLLVVAGGGRVPGGELAAKIEIYDVSACPLPDSQGTNCLDAGSFLGARLLSTPSGVPPQPGVPPEAGVPLQMALLHQRDTGGGADTLAAYVVTSAVGLEAVDVAAAIGTFTGPPDGLVRGDFLDVVVLKRGLVSLVPELGSDAFRLVLFTPQLGRGREIPLPGPAARLFPLENLVVDLDADGNLGLGEDGDDDGVAGKDELFDLVVAGSGPLSSGPGCASSVPCGELYVLDLSSVTDLAGAPTSTSLGHPGPPGVVARIPLPGPAFSVQVDPERLVAYVEVRGMGTAIVDFAPVRDALRTGVTVEGLLDANEDGMDDRVLAVLPKNDVFGGEVRVDTRRGLAFPNGNVTGLDITGVLRECAELRADFHVPPPEPLTIPSVRDALLRIVRSLVASLDSQGIEARVLEQGSGACLWKEGDVVENCRVYDATRSDHDLEFLVPADRLNESQALLEELQAAIPEDPFFEDIPLDFLDRVNLFAVPIELVEGGELPIGPAADIDGTIAEDLGLGRQSLLLLWALDGEYVTGPEAPELLPGPDLDGVLQRLREPEVQMPEGLGIPRLEGYEWALLQEIGLLRSGAMIRIDGFCDDPFFEPAVRDCPSQLRTVAKAAIRAAFARIVAEPAFNPSLILPADLSRSAFRNDDLCRTGVVEPENPPDEPAQYRLKTCDSFEEYALSLAVRARELAEADPDVDDPFPLVPLSMLFRFYCVKVGPAACSARDLDTGDTAPIVEPLVRTDAEAHTFILDALDFIERVQGLTQSAHDDTAGRDTRLFSNPPFAVGHQQICLDHGIFLDESSPRSEVRECMKRVAKRRLDGTGEELPEPLTVTVSREEQLELEEALGLRRYAHLDLQLRVENLGPADAPEALARMYEGNGTEAGTYGPHRDVDLLDLRASEARVLDREPDPDGGPHGLRPVFHALFDLDRIRPDGFRAIAFVVDPENRTPEGDKEDNVAAYFYYGLDLPNPPQLPTDVPTPEFDDRPELLCDPPTILDFTFGLKGSGPTPLGGVAELTAGIYEDVTLIYRLHNPNEFPIYNVSVHRAGDVRAFIPELPPGAEEIHTEPFTPVQPGTELFLAVASAEDDDGNTLPREPATAVLHVTETVQTFGIRLFDASPLNELGHPFSRWLVNREPGTGTSREIIGAVTDGDTDGGGGVIRVEIEGLTGADPVDVSLEDAELAGVTEGVGFLQAGEAELEQQGIALSGLTPDPSGRLTLFYVPPRVFVREAFRAEDSNWPSSRFKKERRVKLRVVQADVGASVRQIRLRRPPVFLVHGFRSERTDWNTFQPLVPPGGVSPVEYTSVEGFDGRLDVFAVGARRRSQWTRPFSELAPELSFDIGVALREYLQGYSLGKIDVVAHSMGGVLTRKLVNEDPRIAAAIRKLISITSPHDGSLAAAKLIEIRARAPLKEELSTNLVVDPLGTGMAQLGGLKAQMKSLVEVQWCSLGMQLVAALPDSLIEGAVDDLAPSSAEIQVLREAPIRVPSHYVLGTTVPPTEPPLSGNPLFHMGVSPFYQGLWTTFGLFCNVTPDEDTLEATKVLQDTKEILATLISLGKASGIRQATKRREELLKLLRDTFKKYVKNEIFPSDPETVFGSSPNDRLISEESQRGRIPLPTGSTQQFALTEIVGQTDHKAIKMSPDVVPATCLGVEGNLPVITEDFEVLGDGTLGSACKVLHLLEADPGGEDFFQEVQ